MSAPVPADPTDRPRPQRRGRLTVFVGYASGVGKTWRLLDEGEALRARGADVAIGWIDAHGHAETAERIRRCALPTISRRTVEAHGVTVDDLDVDAVAARSPSVCLIDDVPHTNPPGARRLRRCEDVADVLDRGIDVVSALDVQYLEGLGDLVQRATGLRVRETVPDAFLRGATKVVCVDVAVDDLLARSPALGRGPQLGSAQLSALREMALREVAENLGRRAAPTAAPAGVNGRVLVCLASDSPRAETLLRRAARVAGRLNTNWHALHVRAVRPGVGDDHGDAETQRRLARHGDLARSLGAEIDVVRAVDPVRAVLQFARSRGVTHVIVGKSGRSGWFRRLRPGFIERLIEEAGEIDVHVVGADEAESQP